MPWSAASDAPDCWKATDDVVFAESSSANTASPVAGN